MCWPLSSVRSPRSMRRARPPSRRAVSNTQTTRPAPERVTAAAMPAQPPPMTATGTLIARARWPSIPPRGFPRGPGLEKRRQRDPAVEDAVLVALDFGEQRLVDCPGDQARPLCAPFGRGQDGERARVEGAGAFDLVRHQRRESCRDAAPEQIVHFDAKARELILRQVDAAAACVFPDVADDVGELESNAEIARVVSCGRFGVAENLR